MGINFPTGVVDGNVYVANQLSGPLYQYHQATASWRRFSGTASRSNKVVNPAFQISEENGDRTIPSANLPYPCDQWVVGTNAGPVYDCVHMAVPTPRGSKYRLMMFVTTAYSGATGNQYSYIRQPIEGWRIADLNWGTTDAQWAVLRFGFSGMPGTYAVSISNGDYTRSFVWPFTVGASEGGNDKEYTFIIPPCTNGVWQQGNGVIGLNLVIVLTAGSTFQTNTLGTWQTGSSMASTGITANAAVVGNTFSLFDVGLYADPNRTGVAPEFQAPDYIQDLQDCVRYWQKVYVARGMVATATAMWMQIPLFVRMANTPAQSLVTLPNLRVFDGLVAPTITGFGSNNTTPDAMYCVVNASAGGLTPGRACVIMADRQTATYIAMNARLA